MPAPAPFVFSLKDVSPTLIELVYGGHMPAEGDHLRRTEALVASRREPVGLLYDVREFTSFHPSQVQQHGALFTRLGKRVTGVAVIGARPVVRFGAISVSLISQTPIATFDTRDDGRAWLETMRAKKP